MLWSLRLHFISFYFQIFKSAQSVAIYLRIEPPLVQCTRYWAHVSKQPFTSGPIKSTCTEVRSPPWLFNNRAIFPERHVPEQRPSPWRQIHLSRPVEFSRGTGLQRQSIRHVNENACPKVASLRRGGPSCLRWHNIEPIHLTLSVSGSHTSGGPNDLHQLCVHGKTLLAVSSELVPKR